MLSIQQIESTYSQFIPGYKSLAEMLERTFKNQLDSHKIHAVTSRAKELKSLIGKIVEKSAKEEHYESLEDITDLCGVRVITNMASDVDLIAEEIRKLGFIIDDNNYKDHRDKEPNDFGYLSLHLVLSVGEGFSKFDDYDSVKGLKAEVQIRSILQHAWAEMEHSFGYKSKDKLPKHLKRYVNRLSAVLESADLDFVKLKAEKDEYLANSKKQIEVDALNIGNLIAGNDVMNEIRAMLWTKYQVAFSIRKNYETIFKKLEFFKIGTIKDLEDVLSKHHNNFVKFVDLLFERRRDNRKHILYEAPLEYFMHYLGSAQDLSYWLAYRNYESTFCKVDMDGEVTDFIQLHKDAGATTKINSQR